MYWKKRASIGFVVFVLSLTVHAQKVDSIYFHLYTDSLKKEVHNYINVDGLLHNGRYVPLDTTQLMFSSSGGRWIGNSIFFDKSYPHDSVVINVKLKENPIVSKTVTVYLKKLPDNEVLKTEEEILNDMQQNKRKRKH